MKQLDLVQGSKEWLSLRKRKVMASDAPIIIGVSPYKTPYRLWQEKLDLVDPEPGNYATDRGHALEPIARSQFNDRYQRHFIPIVALSDEYDFIGASLDGYDAKHEEILEIKCNGNENHQKALANEIPDHHICQMQVQMVVTGLKSCCYYSFNGQMGHRVDVPFDADYFNRILPKLKEYYRMLICLEPPPLDKRDYKLMETQGWVKLANRYRTLEDEIKCREQEKDIVRKQLIALAGDDNCQGGGIKLQKISTKGRICYENIPQLKGVDFEPFRKPSLESWRVYLEHTI